MMRYENVSAYLAAAASACASLTQLQHSEYASEGVEDRRNNRSRWNVARCAKLSELQVKLCAFCGIVAARICTINQA